MGNTCIKPAIETEAEIDHNNCCDGIQSNCCQFKSFTCCVITQKAPRKHHKDHTHKATVEQPK